MLLPKNIKCVISDVDDTLADTYSDIDSELVPLLERLLSDGVKLLLISGSNIDRIFDRVVSYINPALRKNIFVAHCNGVETYNFFGDGTPRRVEKHTLSSLKGFDIKRLEKFVREYLAENSVMFDMSPEDFLSDELYDVCAALENSSDVQFSIDFFFIGERAGFNIRKFRDEFTEDIEKELNFAGIDCEVKRGGLNAVDFAALGVNKGRAIKKVIVTATDEFRQRHSKELPTASESKVFESHILINDPSEIEVWGDSFLGGSDFDMCAALPKKVRKINFRKVPFTEELIENNVQTWDGERDLHNGLLEYLRQSLLQTATIQ